MLKLLMQLLLLKILQKQLKIYLFQRSIQPDISACTVSAPQDTKNDRNVGSLHYTESFVVLSFVANKFRNVWIYMKLLTFNLEFMLKFRFRE